MAKQDDYVRITLRLPPDLHEALLKHAASKSLNAEIVERLSKSMSEFDHEKYEEGLNDRIDKLEKIVMNLVSKR